MSLVSGDIKTSSEHINLQVFQFCPVFHQASMYTTIQMHIHTSDFKVDRT